MGYRAASPMIAVANAAARHVAVVTAPKSIPVGAPSIEPDSTAGCTKMMYTIVTNVVAPATSSVRTDVLFSVRRKKRSRLDTGDRFQVSGFRCQGSGIRSLAPVKTKR